MKTFKRAIALLLLMTVVMLPVTGLCDTGFDTLKMLMELETDAVPLATGTSIYGDVDEDTSRGVLSMIMFGAPISPNVIMVMLGSYEMFENLKKK